MITQKEIAEKAGVSRQLVSHALSGRANVSRETRQRIYDAAKELGYHPDGNWSSQLMLARRYGNKKDAEGTNRPEDMVAPPIYHLRYERACESDNANLVYLDFFQGISEAFSIWKRGSSLASLLEGQRDIDVVRSIVDTGRSSGIINFDLEPETTEYLFEKQFPMVLLNARDRSLTSRGVPGVMADQVVGYVEAWRAAAEAGHRRVVFVDYSALTYKEKSNLTFRPRDCELGAAQAGVGFGLERIVRIPYDDGSDAIWAAFVEACGQPGSSTWPTLIFAQNDLCAASLIATFHAHGVRVPKDISIIGFDDVIVAKYFCPAIATLSKPRFEMGRATAQLMSDLLAGREGSQYQVKVFPCTFVPRGSFGPAPTA